MQFTIASLALCASSALALTVGTPAGPLSAGKPFTINIVRDGGETGSVTVNLRKGDASDLTTIETIGSTTTNSLVFTPATTLANGADYAFEAVYLDQTGKYSAFFSIEGGSASTSASASSSTSVSTITPTAPITTLTSYDASSSMTMTSVSTGSPVVVVPSNTTLTTKAPVTNTAGSTIGVGPTIITGNGTLSNALTTYATTGAGAGNAATTNMAGPSSVGGAAGSSSSQPASYDNAAVAFVASPLALAIAAVAALF